MSGDTATTSVFAAAGSPYPHESRDWRTTIGLGGRARRGLGEVRGRRRTDPTPYRRAD